MILDETSTPSTGTAAQDNPTTDCEASVASVFRTTNSATSNTFVVKLEQPPGNGAINHTPKTNLLQLFSENGKSKNLSFVKALGIGRIVVNRALLKNAKNKQTTTFSRQPWVSSQAHKTIEISRTPSFIRTVNEKENKRLVNNKKDDDISGNLANFMNFKLTGLVPASMKTDLGTNTFEINMKPPELRLPPSERSTVSLSSSKSTFEEVTSKSSEPIDDDLTSLLWLTSIDKDLLKTIRSCNPDDAGISLSGDDTDEEHDYNVESNKTNAVFTANSKVECGSQGGFATRQYGQPYSPNGKPPYSFSCLIFMAVEDSQNKMLPVKEIYSWVCKHFPYFLTAPSGWKNSVRHNLSLNKCFKKVDQGRHSHDPGKGSLWCIDPAYRPNLIQALKRTPFYPYLYPSGISQPLSLNNLASLLPGVISGRIPSWSPSTTQPNSSWADPDVASAAFNLMGLRGNDAIDRHPPKVRSTLEELAAEIFKQNDDVAGTIPLVISDPADDHTYSTVSFGKSKNEISGDRCMSPDSDKSAPDAAYEFETPGTDLESDAEIDERYSDDDCTDSDGDLADSGFARLRAKKGSEKNKGNKTIQLPDSASKTKRSKSSTRNSSKSTQSRSKKSLKVRFQQTKKSKMASPAMRKLKRKFSPQEADDDLTSDADSGKDSPKVQKKSRRRTSPKIAPPPAKKVKKTTFFKPKMHTSPYGTRSSKQTRCSRRIGALEHGNVLERASARKRRRDSVTADTDDEEIKLAAGSLLHLAGFRSPP